MRIIIMYCIGSFNLRDFNYSNYSSDDGEKLSRDFELIAKIIMSEKFDVIALQEINAESPLGYLTKILNYYKNPFVEYQYAFESDMPFQEGRKDPERYGFIWNSKRLRLLELKNKKNPRYYENAGSFNLLRPPYYARFTARGRLGGSNFELRLVNTHIHAGGEKEKIDEFNILVKQILPRICDHQELSLNNECMPSYTFLMGDYNLVLNKSEFSIYRIEKITTTNYTGAYKKFFTVQDEKTSLKMANGQGRIEECYSNDYDHFTYETELEDKLAIIPQRVEALSKYMSEFDSIEEKLGGYRKKVSDHVPIKLILDI